MSIELRLYCDVTPALQHPVGDDGCDAEACYAGSQARQDAERDGWVLFFERNVAICPECTKAGVRIGDVKPTDTVDQLRLAIEWAEKHHPLPRCEHGHALRDHGGELLEPTCGCRFQTDPVKAERMRCIAMVSKAADEARTANRKKAAAELDMLARDMGNNLARR